MSYGPHEKLIAPAQASSGVIRLIGGCIAIALICMLLVQLAVSIQQAFAPGGTQPVLVDDLAAGTTPTGVLANLYYFALITVSLWITLWVLHKRTLGGLIGPRVRAIRQFVQVFRSLILLFAVLMLLPSPEGLESDLNLAVGKWLLLLPLGLLGLLIQTSAEELIFRGYLQSQLAARFRHPLIWIGVPSALFALLHYDQSLAGDYAFLVVLWAFGFGMVAADLTARSGTLGPAIAMHMVNNIAAILIAAPEGYFDGIALYSYPFSGPDAELLLAWMPVEMLILLCSWLTARVALRC